MSVPKKDIEPEIEIVEEDEESSLPEAEESDVSAADDQVEDSLAAVRAAILRYA